ncbi:MAG: LysM peptidoglycan-binding domain-containing protein, partial [Gammaproteobacteria bacterium]
MKKMLVGFVAFCLCSLAALADTVTLKEGHPDTYTVQKGDTLWDISARFLQDPWLWSDIWDVNPEIENPHLIFPGDVIRLVWKDGQPRLTVSRGAGSRTVKLSPQARVEPIDTAIPAIPLDKISVWLRRDMIASSSVLAKAPYVVATEDARIIGGAGDKVFVKGALPEEGGRTFGIYRKGKAHRDPVTNELLGVEAKAIAVGFHQATADNGVATLQLNETHEEVRIGDLVLRDADQPLQPVFMPSRPEAKVEGFIIDAGGTVSNVGINSMVLINRGEREGLK